MPMSSPVCICQPSWASSCSNPSAQPHQGCKNLRLSSKGMVPKVHLKIRQQAEKFSLASCAVCSSVTQKLQREQSIITHKTLRPWTSEEWCRSHRAVEKSQNHRSVRLERTSGDHLVPCHHHDRVIQRRLHRNASRLVLNVSRGRLPQLPWEVQCSATLSVKKLKLWGKC